MRDAKIIGPDWRTQNAMTFSGENRRPEKPRENSKMVQCDHKREEIEQKKLLEKLYGY